MNGIFTYGDKNSYRYMLSTNENDVAIYLDYYLNIYYNSPIIQGQSYNYNYCDQNVISLIVNSQLFLAGKNVTTIYYNIISVVVK